MKKNLLKMALLAFATFAASVASAQTYSGKITSSDWSGDKGLESDVDYSLTYIESTKKLNFEFTVPCDKKINVAYFFAEHGFGETTIGNPQSVDGTYTLSGTTGGAFVFEKGAETWFTLKLVIDGVGDIVTNRIAYKAGEENTAKDTEAPAWVSDPTAVANSTSATISVNANDNVSKTLTYEVSKTADFATSEATVNGKANGTTEIALKGLSPETNYTYYVRVKDMAGNIGDVKTVTFTTTAQAAVVATYYGVFYPNDWAEKVTVGGKEVAPQINWKAETLEGYNDVIVTAELSEALSDGAALKFCAFIEGGVGPVDNKVMAATGKANEYTIKLSEVLPKGKTLEKDQIFGQFFFRLFPTGEGAFSMTKILPAEYKVGASNDPIATDTKAPEWGVDPVVEKVTDKTAEIVVNVTDDSGSAVITLTGDNGFAELKKEVKADCSNQTIVLNGLTANTAYNLTLAIADAAGNAGESRTVNFTTLETPDREVLYHSFDFTSDNWKKNGDSNTFAPNGRLLLTVNADNTVTVKVTVDEGAEAVEFVEFILHGIETFRINAQEDGSFVGTSTNSISNRDASQIFHLNFVLKNGVGNSELYRDGMSFKPSEGSTSAVAEVEAEAAKVVAANGVIRVEGDKTFAVYTVAGQLAFRGMGEVRLDKGVYVVVVDGKAQKVML
uniref:fibronectin type III domain-containing protein n=1 Tax=Candidatus Limisoma sp. TaxID=3076476 RepID=UPI00402602C4